MSAQDSQFRPQSSQVEAIVIGGSAGGIDALVTILSALPENFALPVLVTQHLHPSSDGLFAWSSMLASHLKIIEPCDKEPIERGSLYAAPANYHMLVEKGGTISLSVDGKINWSRPSIDVLFESATRVWGALVVAVILSGANDDGAEGIRRVKSGGGLTIAQDPTCAKYPVMPQAAIDTGSVDVVLPELEIGHLLAEIAIKCRASATPVAGDGN